MPRGNGTGPMGMGRMTGRGAGYCSGTRTPGYTSAAGFEAGGGCGYGHGFRRMAHTAGIPGWRRCGHPGHWAAGQPVLDEKTVLRNQAEFLEDQLRQIKSRLAEVSEEA